MTEFIEKAKLFAVGAHSAIDQRRKYTNAPYWYHCAKVAELVRAAGGTERMIAAAWLHDVVEDTSITHEMIDEIFGSVVSIYVRDLTNCETGNRKERKAKANIRLANASPEAQTIKLADIIDNTRSIVEHDPEFAKVYMAEKREQVEVLRKGNQTLWNEANKIIADYYYDKDE